MKSTHQRVGTEPIPGYVLRKRLGAGGYGEVWLADAPGGLQKAVKLVFGAADQNLARTELKSLQRIKEVNHPFLLSLERIEVIDDQLIIITELADESLLQRFRWHRRQGTPGIPRGKLLEYLHDAAVGLDFLEHIHSLQHLDVKPGNLLLLADRIKVADFGLVKDLSSSNHSLIRGLTPSYSAPEIFDGRPNARSDQYSLAIVYMEMLSGNHPFRGRTTGELARQHLTQKPDLESLPPADRSTVARALAKNPADRYLSCRQFVEQLQKIRTTSSINRLPESGLRAGGASDIQNDASNASGESAHQKSSTQSGLQSSYKFLSTTALRHSTREANFSTPHSMFIGLGGFGAKVLQMLRLSTFLNCDSQLSADEHRWLAIDTVPLAIEQFQDCPKGAELPPESAVRLPIYRPVDYRKCDPGLLAPISRRWLYNIPRSKRTEGVRPLATLALLDHYSALRSRIQDDLSDLVRNRQSRSKSEQPLQIYLMCSLHGGTGSALLAEIGLMIRQIMTELAYRDYRLTAVASLANCSGTGEVSLPAAAALASFSELHHLMESSEEIPCIYPSAMFAGSEKPFDWLTIVDGGLIHCPQDAQAAAGDAADFILMDSQTAVGCALNQPRINEANAPLGWLRTGMAIPLQLGSNLTPDSISLMCVGRAIDKYVKLLGKHSQIDAASAHASSRRNTGECSAKVDTSFEHAIDLLVADLEFVTPIWGERVSLDPSEVANQIEADIESWEQSTFKLMETESFTWSEVDTIQQSAIQRLEKLESTKISQLAAELAKSLPQRQRCKKLLKRIHEYLKTLVARLGHWQLHFREQRVQLSKLLATWRELLDEQSPNAQQYDATLISSLPTGLQAVVARTCEHSERWLEQRLQEALRKNSEQLNQPAIETHEESKPDEQLRQFLFEIENFLREAAAENELELARSTTTHSHQERSVSILQLDKQVPGMARFGGEFHRVAVSPQKQIDALQSLLIQQGVAETTSVLPCASSLESHLVCEGRQPNFSLTVAHYCHPTAKTLQLAERLHTRTDVDWPTVGNLLELAQPRSVDVVPVGKPATTPMTGGGQSAGFGTLCDDRLMGISEQAGS